MIRKAMLYGIAIGGLLLASCGGGDGDAGQPPFGAPRGQDVTPTSAAEGGGGRGGGEGNAGPVTLTTEPGRASVVVNGETFEYGLAGAVHYSCDILDDRITVNFQTDGGDLLIQGGLQQNGWVANVTFMSTAEEGNVQYSANIPANADAFGLGDSALSFEGTVSRMENFDPSTIEDLPATIAVNCASPGGEPTAMIGGDAYEFPLSGAQSVQCDVTPERFEVRINRLAIDDLQLEAQGRQESGNWVGAMVIYAGDERYTSQIAQDGDGLEVDGSRVIYTGTFTATDGEEQEGSLSVTCQ